MNRTRDEAIPCRKSHKGGQDDPPVYVSYADYLTLTKNVEAFKKAAKSGKIGSDGESCRASSEDISLGNEDEGPPKKRIRRTTGQSSSSSDSSSSSNRKVITADVSDVPPYQVQCCRQTFSSTSALFAHLRLSHKVGVQPNLSRRCKLCRVFVNEDLVMLHIELLHTITNVEVYKISFGVLDTSRDKEKQSRYLELVPVRSK